MIEEIDPSVDANPVEDLRVRREMEQLKIDLGILEPLRECPRFKITLDTYRKRYGAVVELEEEPKVKRVEGKLQESEGARMRKLVEQPDAKRRKNQALFREEIVRNSRTEYPRGMQVPSKAKSKTSRTEVQGGRDQGKLSTKVQGAEGNSEGRRAQVRGPVGRNGAQEPVPSSSQRRKERVDLDSGDDERGDTYGKLRRSSTSDEG